MSGCATLRSAADGATTIILATRISLADRTTMFFRRFPRRGRKSTSGGCRVKSSAQKMTFSPGRAARSSGSDGRRGHGTAMGILPASSSFPRISRCESSPRSGFCAAKLDFVPCSKTPPSAWRRYHRTDISCVSMSASARCSATRRRKWKASCFNS